MNPTFEQIIYPENSSLTAIQYATPQIGFEWHHHPEVELTWVGGGRGQRYVGDHVEGFGEADLVLLGSDLPHSWSGLPMVGRSSVKVMILQFLPDRLFSAQSIPEFEPLNTLFTRAARGLSFGEKTQQTVCPQFAKISSSEGLERYTLLLEILRCLAEASDVSDLASDRFQELRAVKGDRRIERVMALMNERFPGPLMLDDLAETAAMSRSAFCRYFQRMTGSTPIAHLAAIRISQACSLLRDTELSVAEICYESGFGNLSNFNRQFKRSKKLSPRAYRNQWKPKTPA